MAVQEYIASTAQAFAGARISEILQIVNIWLFGATLIGLILGVYRFKKLPLVGSWFRWKSFGWAVIIGYDFVLIYADIVRPSSNLPSVVRLTLARLVINWEIWYCFHYGFYKLNVGKQESS